MQATIKFSFFCKNLGVVDDWPWPAAQQLAAASSPGSPAASRPASSPCLFLRVYAYRVYVFVSILPCLFWRVYFCIDCSLHYYIFITGVLISFLEIGTVWQDLSLPAHLPRLAW